LALQVAKHETPLALLLSYTLFKNVETELMNILESAKRASDESNYFNLTRCISEELKHLQTGFGIFMEEVDKNKLDTAIVNQKNCLK